MCGIREGCERMRIRNEETDLSEPKTLKVSLPARLHLKLHSLKILTGTTISDTVEDALDEFFADRGSEQPTLDSAGEAQ